MSYPKNPGFRAGQHKLVCDVCGEVHISSQMRRRWDNLMVCSKDWEMRQPQDFVRGVPDNQAVRPSRPEPDNVFLAYGEVTSNDL